MYQRTRTNILILISIICLGAPLFVYAQSAECPYTFSRDLGRGSRGVEAKNVQTFINEFVPDMKVARSGPGSPGNETTYFGPLTGRAVTEFQETYAADVLHPLDLSRGTGYWGPSSRKKAREICADASEGTSVSSQDNETTSSDVMNNVATRIAENTDALNVFILSEYAGDPGDTISVTGTGFTRDTTLHFGESHRMPVQWQSNGRISFTVPDIPYGMYEFWAANAREESTPRQFFVVTDPEVAEPRIIDITPSEGGVNTRVTIRGSGFTEQGNRVYTGMGVAEGVPSPDGSTLSVDIGAHRSSGLKNIDALDGVRMPLWIYVVNDRGVSERAKFDLSL